MHSWFGESSQPWRLYGSAFGSCGGRWMLGSRSAVECGRCNTDVVHRMDQSWLGVCFPRLGIRRKALGAATREGARSVAWPRMASPIGARDGLAPRGTMRCMGVAQRVTSKPMLQRSQRRISILGSPPRPDRELYSCGSIGFSSPIKTNHDFHQPLFLSSTIISHQSFDFDPPSSPIINHQASSLTKLSINLTTKHHQPLPTIINHYQPLPTKHEPPRCSTTGHHQPGKMLHPQRPGPRLGWPGFVRREPEKCAGELEPPGDADGVRYGMAKAVARRVVK